MTEENLPAGGQRISVHSVNDLRNTVIIPNETAQDASLSWAARGLLLYMLSLPADWSFRENDLANRSPMGRKHLRSIVKELESAGYLKKTIARTSGGQIIRSDWKVWARLSERAEPAEPPAGNLRTENRPVDKTLPATGVYPWAQKLPEGNLPEGNLPTANLPEGNLPAAKLPEGNGTTYKDSKEQNPHNPKTPQEQKQHLTPSSLREGPPQAAPVVTGARDWLAEVEHAPWSAPHAHNGAGSITVIPITEPQPAPDTPACPSKADDTAAGCTAITTPPRTASKALARATSLPDYAEPYRESLVAWYRTRADRHKAKAGEALSARSLQALAYAHQQGVLEEFTALASETGWLSLGFNGYRTFIDELLNDKNGVAAPGRFGSRTLGFGGRATTRGQEALNGALAFWASQENTDLTDAAA